MKDIEIAIISNEGLNIQYAIPPKMEKKPLNKMNIKNIEFKNENTKKRRTKSDKHTI
jgi:hypothetical protein